MSFTAIQVIWTNGRYQEFDLSFSTTALSACTNVGFHVEIVEMAMSAIGLGLRPARWLEYRGRVH